MKNKIILYRTISVILLMIAGSSLFGQSSVEHETVELSSIPKIVMFIFAVGGVFIGYIQLRMSIKLAALDAKFVNQIKEVKDALAATLRTETEKIELKLKLSANEIEFKMATTKDIDNIEKIQALQYNAIVDKIKGLEKQLELAANIYKRDNRDNV